MTGARLELGNPESYATAREYIESHLAPAVTELQRIMTELMAPGATSAEDYAVDMTTEVPGPIWQRLDKRLEESARHVVFDGSEYFSLSKEVQQTKQVKVQLTATVYAYSDCALAPVSFRLARDDGAIIDGSLLTTASFAPVTLSCLVPFGDGEHSIAPSKRTYFIEGNSAQRTVMPVCRRFSLSFIYI